MQGRFNISKSGITIHKQNKGEKYSYQQLIQKKYLHLIKFYTLSTIKTS